MPDNAKPLILLTRSPSQARRYAGQWLRPLLPFVELRVAPLVDIVPVAFDAGADPVAALIFTSENGVRAAEQCGDWRGLTAYCVGARTAEAAKSAGFDAISAEGSADDLVALIAKSAPEGRLLHLHGAETRGDVVGRLTDARLRADGLVAYEQKTLGMPEGWTDALSHPGPILAPLFSPRSAERFAQVLGSMVPADLILPCLSRPVADALPPKLQARTEIANAPTAEALTAVLARHISP